MDGWLRLELMAANDGDVEAAYQVNNKILSALIRAKIPILGLGVEGLQGRGDALPVIRMHEIKPTRLGVGRFSIRVTEHALPLG